jgi:hypothetical protein
LVRSRDELEEYHGIHRDVTSSSGADDGPEKTYRVEIAESSDRGSEDAAYEDGGVEGRLSADEV